MNYHKKSAILDLVCTIVFIVCLCIHLSSFASGITIVTTILLSMGIAAYGFSCGMNVAMIHRDDD